MDKSIERIIEITLDKYLTRFSKHIDAKLRRDNKNMRTFKVFPNDDISELRILDNDGNIICTFIGCEAGENNANAICEFLNSFYYSNDGDLFPVAQ